MQVQVSDLQQSLELHKKMLMENKNEDLQTRLQEEHSN
jgi:hypothetical protein